MSEKEFRKLFWEIIDNSTVELYKSEEEELAKLISAKYKEHTRKKE